MKKPLKFFLGNTIEEAKEMHDRFVNVINAISREYSLSTGIDKKELVNESFIALGNTINNYMDKKGVTFNQYAKYSIKRHLNDYIKNNSVIGIPRYINRAIVLLRRLDNVLVANGYDISAEEYILNCNDIDLNESDYIKCKEIITYLKNIAVRANVSLEKLIKRATYIPSINPETNHELIEDPEADDDIKMIVSTLLEALTEEEKIIAKGIMEGKSKKELAKEFNKSDTWINNKLKEIGRRIPLPK